MVTMHWAWLVGICLVCWWTGAMVGMVMTCLCVASGGRLQKGQIG